ncbi:hypothetical protein GYMLUDRAFT_494654 [Collybiopsis luxurians FD-317 M1]|uniref:F-box domain-containing protein n=1 Tax=Collybiopsis luxurians FD-317 M1 TaxID=944289 RepID=A0A0D0C5W7_9AGAR|nr:hypothetical protein GYMLUDRAFT_494654 [Collybiopsis luxurians FD-317 M1]
MSSEAASETGALKRRLEEEIRREQELKAEHERVKLAYEMQRDLVFRIRNSFTAVHQFPSEILSEFFCAYMEACQDTPLAQLLLTHVCSTWRNVALNNTPKLWTTLYLSLGKDITFTDHPSMITDWLNRSGSLPLTLRIKVPRPKAHFYIRQIDAKGFPVEIAEALVPFSFRVQSLSLHGPPKSLMPILILSNPSFPILEEMELIIHRQPWNTKWPKKQQITSFGKSPLRKLKLHYTGDILSKDYSVFGPPSSTSPS